MFILSRQLKTLLINLQNLLRSIQEKLIHLRGFGNLRRYYQQGQLNNISTEYPIARTSTFNMFMVAHINTCVADGQDFACLRT